MAHFARIDNGIVREVIVISDDVAPDPAPDNEQQGQAFIADVLGLAGEWRQTSYNGNFRGAYAAIGYVYVPNLDVFAPPSPFPSWTLDESTLQWVPPVPEPADGEHRWDEESLSWVTL